MNSSARHRWNPLLPIFAIIVLSPLAACGTDADTDQQSDRRTADSAGQPMGALPPVEAAASPLGAPKDAPVVVPGQLMELSPEDEFFVISVWHERLNGCLAAKGEPAYEAELDSLDDVVAYREARDAKLAGSYGIELPARTGAGVFSSDPIVRACADEAESSVRTPSGWSLYAPPQASVDAMMEVNDRVYERLADARAEWSECMETGFGYVGADKSIDPLRWNPPVEVNEPDVYDTLVAADESCLESIGYYDTQLSLTIDETKSWANDNAAILDRLAAEAAELLDDLRR